MIQLHNASNWGMDWSNGSRVGFLQTQLFPVCQTLAAKGWLWWRFWKKPNFRQEISLENNTCDYLKLKLSTRIFSPLFCLPTLRTFQSSLFNARKFYSKILFNNTKLFELERIIFMLPFYIVWKHFFFPYPVWIYMIFFSPPSSFQFTQLAKKESKWLQLFVWGQ